MKIQQFQRDLNYLSVYLLTVPVTILLQDVFPFSPIIKGQGLSIVVPWAIAAIAVIFWIKQPRIRRRFTVGRVAIVILLAAWVWITTLDRIDNQGFNYNTYLIPMLMLMLIIKPLTFVQVKNAASVLAASTLMMIFIAEIVAALSSSREISFNLGLRFFGVTGLMIGDGRWEGPFGNPNYAGPVMAFLVVYSLTLKGVGRWILVVPSLILLLISGSRSGLLGLLAGLACYFIFSNKPSLEFVSVPKRLILVSFFAVSLALLSFYLDPTLNFRTPVWPLYVDYWLSNPVTGVGTQKIQFMIDESGADPVSVHAHNLLLDLLGRYGSIAALLVLGTLGLGIFAGYRTAKCGSTVGLALVVSFSAIGLSEVHGSWGYLSEPLAWLTLGILFSDAYDSRRNGKILHEHMNPSSESTDPSISKIVDL